MKSNSVCKTSLEPRPSRRMDGRSVPPGYIIGPDYKLQYDPDEQVQSVIRLILDQFVSLGSLSGLLRYLRQHHIEMPYRVSSGPNRGQLQWHRPHRETLRQLVRRPAYAGVYTWGRGPLTRGGRYRGSVAVVGSNGNRRTVRCSYPIITLPTSHGSNTKTMSAAFTSSVCGDRCRGQHGSSSLLAGLVVCGSCGCRMQTRYTRTLRYDCQRHALDYGTRAVRAWLANRWSSWLPTRFCRW